ncbi:MAG: PIN domain-containing protein [Verrucomicrobia bacterium]|nr:PIN domain-containing protein [Verrucomicrobiota bacterium]
MGRSIFIDSNILIDLQIGVPPALAWLVKLDVKDRLHVSMVSVAEAYQWPRHTAETLIKLDRIISTMEIHSLTDERAMKAAGFVRKHGKEAGLLDAFIAATCADLQMRLYTRNGRDFPMLTNKEEPYVWNPPK